MVQIVDEAGGNFSAARLLYQQRFPRRRSFQSCPPAHCWETGDALNSTTSPCTNGQAGCSVLHQASGRMLVGVKKMFWFHFAKTSTWASDKPHQRSALVRRSYFYQYWQCKTGRSQSSMVPWGSYTGSLESERLCGMIGDHLIGPVFLDGEEHVFLTSCRLN